MYNFEGFLILIRLGNVLRPLLCTLKYVLMNLLFNHADF